MSGGTTAKYHLPWPGYDDPADIPADVQALATTTDSALGTVDGKTTANGTAITKLQSDVAALKTLGPGALKYDGPVLGTTFCSPSAGWKLDAGDANRTRAYRLYINPSTVLVVLHVALQRTGGTLTASSRGNIVDTQIATLSAAYRPVAFMPIPGVNNYYPVVCALQTNGWVYLTALSGPGQTLVQDDYINLHAMFVRGA